MKDIRRESKDAHTALIGIPPKLWSKAYFDTTTKCDVVTNNMSECFNSWILEARYKPILTMFEDIKTQVMERIHTKRDEMLKRDGKLCPRILTKVNKSIELTKYCNHTWDGGHMYEVSDKYGKYVVDIEKYTCSCGLWQLSGVPCHHAATGILHQERPVEDFVNPCYYIENYLKSYNHLLKPMSGSNNWPTTGLPILLPPLTKRLAGRPKRCRRKDPNEESKSTGKVSRKGTPMMCSKCKQYGHNKLGCRNTPTQQQNIPASQPTERRPKFNVKRKQATRTGNGNATGERSAAVRTEGTAGGGP